MVHGIFENENYIGGSGKLVKYHPKYQEWVHPGEKCSTIVSKVAKNMGRSMSVGMAGAVIPAAIALPPVGIGLAAGAAAVAAANAVHQKTVKKKNDCCDEDEDSKGCTLRYR